MGIERPSPLHPHVRASIRRRLLTRCGAVDGDLLLYAGRLSPEKNVDVLPDVLASLAGRARPLFLVVAGDGPLRDTLEARAAALAPGRTLFVGHIADRSALGQLTGSVDAFIHPNPREPFGIGPLEALAAGTPLVAPRTGGLVSYATDENAWLAGSDVSSLAGAVARCLDDAAGAACEGGAWDRDRVEVRVVRERVAAAAALRSACTRSGCPGRVPRAARRPSALWPARRDGGYLEVPRK